MTKVKSIILKNKVKIGIIAVLIVVSILSAFLLHEIYLRDHMKLNKRNIHTIVGKTWKLKTNVDRKVEWRTVNNTIAEINQEGVVEAISAGETKIIARSMGRELECVITVDDPTINVEHLDMIMGETAELKVENTTFSPNVSVEGENIKYENNIVTALDVGEAVIHLNVGGKELICSVNIKKPEMKEKYDAEKGKKIKVKLNNAPSDDTKVQWRSNNEDVAKILSIKENVVKLNCKNVGVANLIATINNKDYVTKIYVKGDQQISIDGDRVMKGEKLKLGIKNVIPSYTITWENATVEQDGTVTFEGKERGTFTVKAIVDTGIGKEEITKEIKVLEKKLNTEEWKGFAGESFEIEVQDAEDVKYEYDEKFFSRDENKFTALQAGDSEIIVKDIESSFTFKVHVDSNGSKVVEAMEETAQTMAENGFTYSQKGYSRSLDKALKENNGATNCMVAISWALQKAGFIDDNDIIYYNANGLGGGGLDSLEDDPRVEIFYPDADAENCELQPGDICCFDTPHMSMFAGKSSDGSILWYSAGRDGTDTGDVGGTFTNKDKIGPKKQNFYDNKSVECVIRFI